MKNETWSDFPPIIEKRIMKIFIQLFIVWIAAFVTMLPYTKPRSHTVDWLLLIIER